MNRWSLPTELDDAEISVLIRHHGNEAATLAGQTGAADLEDEDLRKFIANMPWGADPRWVRLIRRYRSKHRGTPCQVV